MPQGVLPYPELPHIHNIHELKTANGLLASLGKNPHADPALHFATIKLYCERKLKRSHPPLYVSAKLDRIEVSAPQSSGDAFVQVREYFGFPKSRVFTSVFTSSPSISVSPPEVPPPAYKAVDHSAPVLISPAAAPPPARRQSVGNRLSSALGGLNLGAANLGAANLAAPASPISRSEAGSPASIVVDGEHALEMLRDFDTAFIVDDSSSMTLDGRWEQARAAVKGVVGQACKYDDDGVDVYFLNGRRDAQGVRKPKDVDALFRGLQPRGMTPTGKVLERILRDYMRKLEAATDAGHGDDVKPLNIIVITDGAPTDDPESVIVTYARRLDRGDFPLSQIGIQFFQIGNDPAATKALQELDDDLGEQHDIRDIVDTVPYQGDLTPELIVKVLLGGVNRRLDRKAGAA